MNLIEEWNRVPSGDEIVLANEHGDEIARVIKRGSFISILRQLYELVPEKDILSDRWRWRVR